MKLLKNRVVLAAVLSSIVLTGCQKPSGSSTGDAVTVLRYQGLTGTVTPPELAEDLGYLKPLKLEYVGNVIGGPQDLQTLATGEVDYAYGFNGAIIKFAASGLKPVSVVGAYGSNDQLWMGFFVKEDSGIKTAKDLIGKKISVNTLGAHAEFTIKDYLAKNGLTPEQIRQVELVVLPPVNSEQALRAGQVDVAQLQGVLQDKALARGGVRQLFTDTELYGQFTGGSFVFTQDFIAKHPEVVRTFATGVGKALEWSRTTPRDQVIARLESIIQKRGRNEDASIVKYWRTFGVKESYGALNDPQFQRWITWLEREGTLKPNQLKVNDLYTNQFNDSVAKPAEQGKTS